MDNASFHKGKDMQKMLEELGHILLYLPPYSPDLNPIEKKWAARKTNTTLYKLFYRSNL
jgi:transposase